MLRPSPNHGTLQLPNNDDDDDWVYYQHVTPSVRICSNTSWLQGFAVVPYYAQTPRHMQPSHYCNHIQWCPPQSCQTIHYDAPQHGVHWPKQICQQWLQKKRSTAERGELPNFEHSEMYGVPFSHLFTELQISPIEVHIFPIQLQISTIDLQISTIELEISPNGLNSRYLQLNWRYLQINCRYLQILSIWRYLQLNCRYLQFDKSDKISAPRRKKSLCNDSSEWINQKLYIKILYY